jgi:hypothetical protein
MLIKRAILAGIAAGRITLAFRRWRRPTVRAGGRLRTAIGELAIDAVERIDPRAISDADARCAGLASRSAVLAALDERAEGEVYRIALHLAGADSRAALRRQTALGGEEWEALLRRLARLDAAARGGPWTAAVLRVIAARPGVRAADLAAELGRERLDFKRDVRKLKALGLTESLEVGYRLSPRGRALLRRLESSARTSPPS